MADAPGLAHLSDIPLIVEAVVRRPALKFSELMALRVGSFITTNHPAGETVEVLVGEAPIGTGEFVDANGCAGVRMVTFRGRN
jgi:flagellar motor switch/type III secretory pathway protein FliN